MRCSIRRLIWVGILGFALTTQLSASALKNPLKIEDYAGAQLNTRHAYGYGLYIIEMLPNVSKVAVVSSLSTFSPEPSRSEYPNERYDAGIADLWRWSEVDLEFIPHTKASSRERIQCKGLFPMASCQSYRSDGLSSDIMDRIQKVEGDYTNDILAQSIKSYLRSKTHSDGSPVYPKFDNEVFYSWQDLVKDTGVGRFFRYPNGSKCVRGTESAHCPYPIENGSQLGAWPLPPYLDPPSKLEREHFLEFNVFRTPAGRALKQRGQIKSHLIEQCRGGEASKCDDPNQFYAHAVSNPQFAFNPRFNPYHAFHTYSLVVTPKFIAFYIDAPSRGVNIQQATPVKVMHVKDYPGLKMFGPNMPGGSLEWSPKSGRSILKPDETYRLGDSQIMFSMWMHQYWGGVPIESFEKTRTYIRRVAFYPMTAQSTEPNGALFADQAELDVDFTVYTAENWWFKLRRHFYIDTNDSGDKSFFNVSWVDGSEEPLLDNHPALQLQMSRKSFDGHHLHDGRTFYKITANRRFASLRVLQAKKAQMSMGAHEISLGDYVAVPDMVYALVEQPKSTGSFYDYFPLYDNTLVAIELTEHKSPDIHYCIYNLTPNGFKLVQGADSVASEAGSHVQSCYGLPTENTSGDITLLSDFSTRISFDG